MEKRLTVETKRTPAYTKEMGIAETSKLTHKIKETEPDQRRR